MEKLKNMTISKIALEEHITLPQISDHAKAGSDVSWLIAEMDATRIEMSVLCFNTGRVQNIPEKQKAIDAARRSNEYMASQVAKYPTRLQGFASLPLQDPDAATKELVYCIKELGFRGTLVKGFSQVDTEENIVHLDDPRYLDFWATMQSLGVPLYLHPRAPLKSTSRIIDGHGWFQGSPWFYAVDTATHALRLMASGLFDRYPNLNIVLGHLGEMLPVMMWRVDHRLEKEVGDSRFPASKNLPAKKKLDHYFRNNFYITTSGNFCTSALMNAIDWLGADRIMFAVDSPWESIREATNWFDNLNLSETDFAKIARTNAARLLKWGTPAKTTSV